MVPCDSLINLTLPLKFQVFIVPFYWLASVTAVNSCVCKPLLNFGEGKKSAEREREGNRPPPPFPYPHPLMFFALTSPFNSKKEMNEGQGLVV